MSRLDYVKDLKRLRQIAASREQPDLDDLPLDRPVSCGEAELEVDATVGYALQGQEAQHYLATTETTLLPEHIDDAGGWLGEHWPDRIVIVSPRQHTGSLCRERWPLRSLVDRIYKHGGTLLEDFTVHGALRGNVVAHLGQLPVDTLALFPRRFSAGPYRLSVALETASQTVRRFDGLMRGLDALGRDPGILLDHRQVGALAGEAEALRRQIGALSRYRRPDTTTFAIETTSCVVRTDSGVWYLLYSAERRRNVLIYFGDTPFFAGMPQGLLVHDGKHRAHALATLLEYGFVVPAPADVLDRRLRAIATFSENAQRQQSPEGRRVAHVLDELERLRQDLVDGSQRYLPSLLRRAPRQLMDVALVAASDDPVLHLLLPRLSWHAAMRDYHDTRGFIQRVRQADANEKLLLLRRLRSCLAVGPQNVDVNTWLHHHHHDACKRAGLIFAGRSGR